MYRELIQVRLIQNIPNFHVAAHSAQNKRLAVSRKGRRRDQRPSLLRADNRTRSHVHNVKAFFRPGGNVAAVGGDAERPAFTGTRAGEAIRCELAVLGHPDVHGGAPDGDYGAAIGRDGQGTRISGRGLNLQLVERLHRKRVGDAESAVAGSGDEVPVRREGDVRHGVDVARHAAGAGPCADVPHADAVAGLGGGDGAAVGAPGDGGGDVFELEDGLGGGEVADDERGGEGCDAGEGRRGRCWS